jgi:hypothetical protein
VFPGQQGGPLEHVIAGKAVAFKIAAPSVPRAPASARSRRARRWPRLLGAGHGVDVLTGGTDVHLVLVDLRESELDGQMAEDRLHEIGITVNRNAVPVRPAPAVGLLRPARRALGARHARRAGGRLPEIGASSPRADAGFERAKAELAERVRRSPIATRCTRASAHPPRSPEASAAEGPHERPGSGPDVADQLAHLGEVRSQLGVPDFDGHHRILQLGELAVGAGDGVDRVVEQPAHPREAALGAAESKERPVRPWRSAKPLWVRLARP